MSPANNYKRWTGAERKQLRKLARENTPTRIISHLLGRTVNAVYKMANRMGVSLKPVNQSPDSRRRKK